MCEAMQSWQAVAKKRPRLLRFCVLQGSYSITTKPEKYVTFTEGSLKSHGLQGV